MKLPAHSVFALFIVISALIQTSHAAPPAADPGDPPNLKRYEGSIVFAHSTERYTRYALPLGPWTSPHDNDGKTHAKSQEIEGAFTRTAYVVTDSQRGALEVHRNYLNDLETAGWEVLYQASGASQMHPNFAEGTRVREAVEGSQLFAYPNPETTGYIAARRADDDGDTYATIYTMRYTNNGLTGPYESLVKPETTLVKVDVIKPQAMEQRMVFVDAAAMKSGIAAEGKVLLYGIQFDFNKADLKPESDATLEEIARLLREDAALKLLVVGHTDNEGSLDFNKDLSARRATSVVAALTSRHGIARERLHPEGVAFLAPVASNETDAGRAKNRRVELVRW